MIAVRCNVIDVNKYYLDKAELKQVRVASINSPNTVVLAGVHNVTEMIIYF